MRRSEQGGYALPHRGVRAPAAFSDGLGAGISVGIDALVTREYGIYASPGGSQAGLRMTPLLTPGVQGQRASFSF
ncbi:hypothetical protein LuPra_04696 [Luteitalea pratensis]|uniref:Uncharacterized protein n=1 Tax=Luteitalea pratensis TaxID=1855912 RepID=A0A143PSY6_LUTPR|nr:hypothetical protein [Luteitalea pratensis]AMY11446.1 hypothetical protein LuPra_04696 [Luteitalea pratensis]